MISFVFQSKRGQSMAEINVAITYELIVDCVEKLRLEGHPISVRAVREKLGGRGSFATIQPLLKQVYASVPIIPPETEESLRPIVVSIADKIRQTVLKTSNELTLEKETIQKDLDDATIELLYFEKVKLEYENKIDEMKIEIIKSAVKLEVAETSIINLQTQIDKINKELSNAHIELAKFKYKEENWKSHEIELKETKNEIIMAREKVAHLEGRLKERLLLPDLAEAQQSLPLKTKN
jgi:hypothetical protein